MRAFSCPHCGCPLGRPSPHGIQGSHAPKKKKRGLAKSVALAFLLFVIVSAAVPGMRDKNEEMAPRGGHTTTARSYKSGSPASESIKNQTASPSLETITSKQSQDHISSAQTMPAEDLIANLQRVGLDEKVGWKKSALDGRWTATVRKNIGRNEVSCLIESSSPSTIEEIELEAEIYDRDSTVKDVTLTFVRCLAPLFPSLPVGLPEAIATEQCWQDDGWTFSKENHPRGGGYDLRLSKRR
jgi:hypothetical protein